MIYSIKYQNAHIKGVIILPTSKSISNRLLIMSSLSGGNLKPKGLSDSDDTRAMQQILSSKEGIHDVGHAGTTMRFLTAYFATKPGTVVLTGSERMKKRPIAVLIDLLRELGADIQYIGNEGFPPLRITGKKLHGGKQEINPEVSSQYISALLLIAPSLPGGLELVLKGSAVSASYINLTLQLMRQAGISYTWNHNTIKVVPGNYSTGEFPVEPDWSAASYWYAITALAKKTEVFLPGLSGNSLQGDSTLVKLFESLGVQTNMNDKGVNPLKTGSPVTSLEYDFTLTPDIVQTLVPVCSVLGVPFRFTGTQTLRIKETDRINALCREMRKFGVILEHGSDGGWISWDGRSTFIPRENVLIESYDDHRMAMAFAPLCLRTGSIMIKDPEVVSKSYPGYWQDLEKSGFEITSV